MSFKKHKAKWKETLRQLRLPSDVTAEAVRRFLSALDTPRSLAVSMLFENQEYEQLLDLVVDPKDYENSQSFRDAYLATHLLKKSKFLKTPWDKKKRALDKFLKFEEGCKKTNEFFRSEIYRLDLTTGNGALLVAMQRKISKILGEFVPDELFDLASWGPGVSNQIKGEETFGAKKFQYETGITRGLYSLVKDLLPLAYPSWAASLTSRGFPMIEEGNQVITVAKTSKIDRVIAIEPGINLWFQLGLGRMIRRRLLRVGIDLTNQSRNQIAARSGSISNRVATVDFSSASDSIARGLVEYLFDPSTPLMEWETNCTQTWLKVMDSIRSQYGTVGSENRRWEKFSSMGNGFTFDLETLIFYAAAFVCCKAVGAATDEISIYGDDVIIPVEAYSLFSSFSTFLGFTVNSEKSFSTGCFRESCGEHFYSGVSCKPVYFEDGLTSLQSVYNFANTIRLRSHHFYGCELRFRSMFYWLQGLVPKALRFRVSATKNAQSGLMEATEGGFLSNFDEACPSRMRHQFDGYSVKRLAWIAIKLEVDYDGLLLSRLSEGHRSEPERSMELIDWARTKHLARDKGDGNSVPLRGRTRCTLISAVFTRWYDLGPWL